MKRFMLVSCMALLFCGQAPAPQAETVAQLEARLKTLKAEVATVEGKLAAARGQAMPDGVDLGSLLNKIPANLQWKQGESARTRAERGQWVVDQAKGGLVKCSIVWSERGQSGALLPMEKYPSTIHLVVTFAAPPKEKMYDGDTLEIRGVLKAMDVIGVKAAGSSTRAEIGDVVIVKVIPKH